MRVILSRENRLNHVDSIQNYKASDQDTAEMPLNNTFLSPVNSPLQDNQTIPYLLNKLGLKSSHKFYLFTIYMGDYH